ncbi:MAG: CusA/CzcA family heavy metal efflux RND transporter [Sediminibacterium sp.]|nr:CusA/CzcA family heavy metal efflux RND transporter [Sediminibacterium sp.]
MLNAIIRFSVRNPLIIGLFVLGLIGYGSYEVSRLPIDAVPDITNNQVQVITVAPSFGATDIERLITFPIEQANSNIAGIKEIRSFSRFGLSLVTIVFDDATDLFWARQQVAERLLDVKSIIPEQMGIPRLGPISTGLGEIYQYVLRPKKGYEHAWDETKLRTVQDWIVRRQLLGVAGVAEVSSFGGKVKQYSVRIDPARLQSFGITITDVLTALEKNNQNTGGAYIEKGPSVVFIRTEGLLTTPEEIGNIMVKKSSSGTPLLIRDVATVETGFATRYGALCYNDQGEVAGAVVMMLKGANSNEVIRRVKDRVQQIQKNLPEGVIIEPFLDRSKMVGNAIDTVKTNLLEGALIVLFILVIFLGNLRAGILVASIIPLSLLFAIIMMNWWGVSGNLMSLGALDFGLIVDGAVIIVEAVMAGLHAKGYIMRLSREDMNQQVIHSAGKMMNSAVFGQIIILVVYLPIFTLQGIEGKMFRPMAQTVAFALLGAFLLSLTWVPMMSAFFLSRRTHQQTGWSEKLLSFLEKKYQQVLERLLMYPKTIIAAALVLFASSLMLLSRLGAEFIPALEEGDFAVDTRVLTGSSLTTSIQSTQQAAGLLLRRFPEVEKVVTKIGSGEVPTDPMPMDASDLMVILRPKKEWTSAKTFNELSEKMSAALQEVPGITTGFQYPVQMRFNELMTGARQDVVCKIFGEDLDSLSSHAAELSSLIKKIKGAEDIYVEQVSGMPQVIIQYNRDAIAQYQLNISDVNHVINASFAGQSSGQLYEGEKRFDVVVRLGADQKKTVQDIRQLLVSTPSGSQVPLYLLANIELKDGPNQIQREDAKRRIVVGFNVRNRDVQSIVSELQQLVEKKIKLPPGYYITYGGAFENLQAAKSRLLIAVPIALLLIFILLYLTFGSLQQALLIYSAIPLSAIGGIYFLYLRGMPFSISAGVGFIALFGVAVLNGIVLIAEFNHLKKEGISNIRELILRGTSVRLRPVLITALVASLGFLPMAISEGAGAEVQRPLATVVIGGLLLATLLTLFVLPILYMIFNQSRFPKTPVAPTAIIIPLIFIATLLTGTSLQAQQTISLKAATDTALRNNALIKNDQLRAIYQQKLIETAVQLPPLQVSAEVGRFNSAFIDNRLSIGQSIQFPTVYARQKDLLKEEWKQSILQVAVRESMLKRDVAFAYYQLIYLRQKKDLLQYADSLYGFFLRKSIERVRSGESDILEKASAQNQLGQIQLQLAQLIADHDIAALQFQLLLNSSIPYRPLDQFRATLTSLPSIADTATFSRHPLMQSFRQQQEMADASYALEKSKLLPNLSLHYNNTTIRGIGADEKPYDASTRFGAVQFGVGIPVFAKGQKNLIDATRFSKQIATGNYQAELQLFKNQYESAFRQYLQHTRSLQYFEKEGLPTAELVTSTAGKQLMAGQINYLQWVQLIHQSIATRSQYLETLHAANISAIQLNYLLVQ